MQGSDRSNMNSQLDQGGPSQQIMQCAADVYRDIYASYIGHHSMLAYQGIVENESIGRQRYNTMQKIVTVGRAIAEASRVPQTFHNNTADNHDIEIPETETSTSDSDHDTSYSDTDTSDSDTDTSQILSDATPSQSVQSSQCQTAETMAVDQEELSDPSITGSANAPYYEHTPGTSHTGTFYTVSDSRLSQSVQSRPSRTGEEMTVDLEKLSDPIITGSVTAPYHENIPGTSHTETIHIVSDSPPSQPARSSPSRTGEEMTVDLEVLSDPIITGPVTAPYHENIPGTSHTETIYIVSDSPPSQPARSSPSQTENASPQRDED